MISVNFTILLLKSCLLSSKIISVILRKTMAIKRRVPQVPRSQTEVKILPTIKLLQDNFERYLEVEIANGNASEDTKRTYRSYIRQFLNWCDREEIYPARVKSTQILNYRSYLISEGKSSNTIALTLVALRHFYKSNIALVTDNPTDQIKAPKAKRNAQTRLTYCNLEQLNKLLSRVEVTTQSDPLRRLRDRAIICLMAIQGCRVVEIHRANIGDLRCGAHWDLWIEGKNSQRIIALRDDLIPLLESYLEALTILLGELNNQEPLFISFSNKTFCQRLSRRGISYLVDNYLTQCDLKRIDNHQSRSAHSLRHTAGTLSLAGGASLREVQDLLGHSDPETTAIYAHVLDRYENNPANKIDIDI